MQALDIHSSAQLYEWPESITEVRLIFRRAPSVEEYSAMDLTGFDFSQPARVLWFTHVSRDGQITAGESRPFLEVTDALRFIMEKLNGVHHATASITLDNGRLTLTEVMLLYSRLGRDQRYPGLH